MKKGGEVVQIACKIAYVINGRPLGLSTDLPDYGSLITIIRTTNERGFYADVYLIHVG